jgi:hypothetical protein
MLQIVRLIYIVRWYTWVFLGVFVVYVWSMATGVRFPKDDNNVTERYNGHNNHQYHK